jgi:rRNA maturation RNase YbeY
LSIKIFYDETDFRIKNWRLFKEIVLKVIGKEHKISGDLNFIVTTDVRLMEINIKFLEHDYNTDVITFNYNVGNIINGEIYISIDTVKENAFNYKVSLDNELKRVAIHGVLHLVGYDDKTPAQKLEIRSREDYWLNEIVK